MPPGCFFQYQRVGQRLVTPFAAHGFVIIGTPTIQTDFAHPPSPLLSLQPIISLFVALRPINVSKKQKGVGM
jgi:hypothetical protein